MLFALYRIVQEQTSFAPDITGTGETNMKHLPDSSGDLHVFASGIMISFPLYDKHNPGISGLR